MGWACAFIKILKLWCTFIIRKSPMHGLNMRFHWLTINMHQLYLEPCRMPSFGKGKHWCRTVINPISVSAKMSKALFLSVQLLFTLRFYCQSINTMIIQHILRDHPFMTSTRRGDGGQALVDACGRGEMGVSSMLMSTQKIRDR